METCETREREQTRGARQLLYDTHPLRTYLPTTFGPFALQVDGKALIYVVLTERADLNFRLHLARQS